MHNCKWPSLPLSCTVYSFLLTYQTGMDKVQEQRAQLLVNDMENWGNHHIDVLWICRGVFILKLCSWRRNHFIHPSTKVKRSNKPIRDNARMVVIYWRVSTLKHLKSQCLLFSGVWDFLFSADFLFFENFLVSKFQLFSFIFILFLIFYPDFTLFFLVFCM